MLGLRGVFDLERMRKAMSTQWFVDAAAILLVIHVVMEFRHLMKPSIDISFQPLELVDTKGCQ